MIASRPRLWTSDFVLLSLSGLLLVVSQGMLLAALPLYAVSCLGASPAQIGMLPGMVSIAALIARPAAGYAVDRWGRRWIHIVFLFLVAGFIFGHSLVASFVALLLNRLAYGLFYGVANTATSTIVTDLVPAERRGEGIGYFGMTQTLGLAIGPALALPLLAGGNYPRLFAFGGGLSLAAAILAVWVRHPVVGRVQAHFHLSSLFERRAAWIGAIVFGSTFGVGSILSFITLYATQAGIERSGLFYTVQAAGTVLTRLWSGPLYDRYGPRWLVGAGMAIQAVGFLLLALWRAPVGFFAAAFATGVGLSIAFPALQAMAVGGVAASRRGAANATFLMGQDLRGH